MLQATAVAFATVFVAELGDKSQLLALSLSARYPRRLLLLAVLSASALTVGLSVAAGSLIGRVVPPAVVQGVSAALFLVFAVLTLRDDDDEEDAAVPRGAGGFLAAVTALSLAELGDKTMLASFALAASTSAVGVWVGGTLGMAAAGAVAVVIGNAVWRRLSPRTVRRVSAALFAGVGVLLLVDALRG